MDLEQDEESWIDPSGKDLKAANAPSSSGVPLRLLIFHLNEMRYALHLEAVERVVPAVEITPLPKAPDVVLGVINVGGQIVPVMNLRRRFRLPEREIGISDHLILARTSRRSVALLVDEVTGLQECLSEQVLNAQSVVPGSEYLEAVVRLPDGLLLIHDIDRFLSLDEEGQMGRALQQAETST